MGLPKLERSDGAARRLCIADHLLSIGVAPQTIFKALDIETTALCEIVGKYSPDQPRVSAGNGRISGQWTSDADHIDSSSSGSPYQFTSSKPNPGVDLNQDKDHSASFSLREWDSSQSQPIVSDAGPDPIRPGQQYAQNDPTTPSGQPPLTDPVVPPVPGSVIIARTGDPRIDKVSEILMKTLQVVDATIPQGVGPVYGTAVHVEFAAAVRALKLSGVEVEQSFMWG